MKLLENGIYYTGTVSHARKGMPIFPPDKSMQRGEMSIKWAKVGDKVISAVKWIDNKPVHMITSANGCSNTDTVHRRVKGKPTKTAFPCPDVVKEYNRFMGCVESTQPIKRPSYTDLWD